MTPTGARRRSTGSSGPTIRSSTMARFHGLARGSPANADAYRSLGGEAEMLPFVEAVPAADAPVQGAAAPGTGGRCRGSRRWRRRRCAAHDAHRLFDRPRRSPHRLARRQGPAGHERRYPVPAGELGSASRPARTGPAAARLQNPDGGRVEVLSGDLELVDVGTVFEVSRDGRETRVLVSDGVSSPIRMGPGSGWRPASGSIRGTAQRSFRRRPPMLHRSDPSSAANSAISMSRSTMSSPTSAGRQVSTFRRVPLSAPAVSLAPCRLPRSNATPARLRPCWASPWSGQVKAGDWEERFSD